mgnify:CR=1 FL=1
MATSASKKTAQGASKTQTEAPLHSAASKDIWLAGLGAMAQAQAQAREQGSKAFESLVEKGLAFQRQSQASAQEKINEKFEKFAEKLISCKIIYFIRFLFRLLLQYFHIIISACS